MLDGEVYSAVDKELLEMLNRVKDLCWEYNQIRPTLIKERNLKLREILGKMDDDTFINQPFYCDYGKQYGKAKIEAIEDIEILRFIENGYRVQYIEVDSQTIAVDTPNDLKRVIEYFKEHNIE